jgi:predicted enzyme related to lactoylglutathione lyase
MSKGKILGVGGIFFRCKNEAETKNWYTEHFSLKTDQYGASFAFRKVSDQSLAILQWSPFPQSTAYFGDSGQEFMVNYRVENMDDLVQDLKAKGMKFTDEIVTYEYGKFVHMIDCDGRMVELWEPIDAIFTDNVEIDTFNHE